MQTCDLVSLIGKRRAMDAYSRPSYIPSTRSVLPPNAITCKDVNGQLRCRDPTWIAAKFEILAPADVPTDTRVLLGERILWRVRALGTVATSQPVRYHASVAASYQPGPGPVQRAVEPRKPSRAKKICIEQKDSRLRIARATLEKT